MNSLLRYSLLSAVGFCLFAPSAYAERANIDDLLAMNIEALNNLKVTVASKRLEKVTEAPGIISVITREDIERYGGNDLFDVIKRLPNLDIQTIPLMPTGMGANMRGQTPSGASSHVLTLLDGRPVRESQLGGWDQAFYRAFPLESVERIEMIRGPSSVLYGTNAFSGVLNIITRKAEKSENQGGYVSAGYGSFHTKTGGSSYRMYNEEHDFSISAAINYLDSAGWDYAMTDLTGAYDSDDMARDAVGGYVRADYKNFAVTGFRGQIDNQHQGVVAVWPFGVNKQQREFLDLGYEQPLWADWKANLHITYNGFENKITKSTAIFDENNFHDILYEATVAGTVFDDVNIIAGVTYDDRSGVLEIGESHFDEAVEGAYFQADYKPTNWLKLIGGFQLNKPESAESAELSPRAAAIVNFTPKIGAKLLYGEAFRTPTGSETRLNIPAVIGDPDLKSETIETTELQIFYNAEKYSSALTIYQSDILDIIDIGANPNAPPNLTFLNGGKFEYKGVEFEGKAQINDQFEIQGSLTYQMGKESLTGITDVSSAPHLMFKLGGSYVWDNGITLGIFNQYIADTVKYNTQSPPTAKPNPSVENTSLLTANVSVDLNRLFNLSDAVPKATFTLYGDNLLDEDIWFTAISDNLAVNTIPGYSGRAIYGRLSMAF